MVLRKKILRKKKEKKEKGNPAAKKKKKKGSARGGRRKKKQEITPWSKKERFFVFWVFIATILGSAFLGLFARSWKLPNLPRIKLPSFEGETIIIEGDNKDQKKARKATSFFKEKVKPLSGVYGLYVARLSGGSNYGVNETETFDAASLNKLPVMLAMYKEAEKGNIDLEEKYVLKSSDKAAGSGSLYSKPEGTVVTYKQLVEYMGKESDNTAFSIAKDILGDEKIFAVMNEAGVSEKLLTENKTTPYEIGLFFEEFWKSGIVSEISRDEILGYLTDTVYEDWIANGLPGIRVAHKFGTVLHVKNDAGIVFADADPFVLVILSKGIVEKEADEIIPDVARGIYQVEVGE